MPKHNATGIEQFEREIEYRAFGRAEDLDPGAIGFGNGPVAALQTRIYEHFACLDQAVAEGADPVAAPDWVEPTGVSPGIAAWIERGSRTIGVVLFFGCLGGIVAAIL